MTQPGYAIGREDGLTQREREVLAALLSKKSLRQIGADLGVSKQRVGQIVQALLAKGAVVKTDEGGLAVVIRR